MKKKIIPITIIILLLFGFSTYFFQNSKEETKTVLNQNASNEFVPDQQLPKIETNTEKELIKNDFIQEVSETEQEETTNQAVSPSPENITVDKEILEIVTNLEKIIEEAKKQNSIEKSQEFITNARSYYKKYEEVLKKIANMTPELRQSTEAKLNQQIMPILNDVTPPTLSGIENNAVTMGPVSINGIDETKIKIYINGIEKNLEDLKNMEKENTYEIIAVDEAYNTQKLMFTIDTTAPQKKQLLLSKTTKEQNSYLTVGDVLHVTLTMNETLKELPILEFPNKETFVLQNTSATTYETNIEITTNLFEDGPLNFTIHSLQDIAGNTGENLTNKDASKEFYIDKTIPEIRDISIQKKNDNSNYVREGDTITISFEASESLQNSSSIFLGGQSFPTTLDPKTNQYTADIILTENMTLIENEKIEMIISNIKDLAGNEKEPVYTTGKEESYVIYNNVPVEIEKLEIFSNNANPSVATANDQITLAFTVSEQLQKYPTIKIHDQLFPVQEIKESENSYRYQVVFTVEDSFPEGIVKFSISEIMDKAGEMLNITIDNEQLKENVTVDKTPIKENWLYVLNPSSTNHKRVRTGENLYIELVFDEELITTPMLQVASLTPQEMKCMWKDESDGWLKTKYKCDATVKIEENSGIKSGEVVPIKITNIYDEAGNETILTNSSITEEQNNGYGEVIYDTESPQFDLSEIPTTFVIGKDIYVYPQPGRIIDDVDEITFGEVHMQWFKQQSDGTKGEATKCFGWENWNTTLTNCDEGTYIVTYTVSDRAGNKTYQEQAITLIKQQPIDFLMERKIAKK